MEIKNSVVGKYCIVRGNKFGVFAGTVAEVEGDTVLLTDARRLWYWDGAATLSQLAMEGVKVPKECKFTVTVSSIMLLGAIEIIPTTAEAEANIKEVAEWKR